MAAVRRDHEGRGWVVRSVERDGRGFDLACRKGRRAEDVEVKGVRSAEQSFMITAGEVAQVASNPNFVLVVVTSALSKAPKLTRHTGPEFRRRFALTAVQYRAALL